MTLVRQEKMACNYTTSVSKFWEENYTIQKDTKDLKCPTPEEVHSDFLQTTGLTDMDLDTFKVITCNLGKGIRLNKKRKKNQKRFYNVTSKRAKIETAQHDTTDDTHDVGDTITSQCNITEDNTPDMGETSQSNISEDNQLLDSYLQHQEEMQMKAKTTSALREKHKAPSNRKQMFDILKGQGFYKKFPTKDFKDFEEWLTSPSGGQLKCPEEIISEISRFLYFSNPSKIRWKKLLDTKTFNNYLIATKDAGLGPDGLKTKIERVSTALKYLAVKKQTLHSKCTRARSELSEWLKPLSKQKKVLRMKNSWRDELCGFKLTMDDIDTAVPEATIENFISIMKKAMKDEILTQEEYRVIVDTLITLTITQESAIRPGAFQFMTLEELNNPVIYISSDGTVYNIVFVLNHKTFATHGPIAVPFSESAWVQLHNYLKFVRPQVKPKAPYQELVFLNASGKMISKPGKAVSKVTKGHEKHITPTKIRHCIATAGNDVLTDAERRAVAKGIGHTMDVHNKVYTDKTIKNVKASIEAQKKLHDKSKSNTL